MKRLLLVLLLLGSYATAQTSGTFQKLNGIRFADQYPGADVGAKINAAIADLGKAGGTIIVPQGSYSFSTRILADESSDITIQGAGGQTGGAPAATVLTYTATASPVISAKSSVGFRLRDLQIMWSNPRFDGTVLDLSHSRRGLDTTYADIGSCSFYGTPAHRGPKAGVIISLDKVINSAVHDSVFSSYHVAVRGAVDNTSYASAIEISRNRFSDSTGTAVTAHLQNPSQGWFIGNNTFEMGTAAGTPSVIGFTNSPAQAVARGVQFVGNWIGDTTAAATLTTLPIRGQGWNLTGNYIGGSTHSTAITIEAGSGGINIVGNYFDTHATAVNIQKSANQVTVLSNYQSSVAQYMSGAPASGMVFDTSGRLMLYGGAAQFAGGVQLDNFAQSGRLLCQKADRSIGYCADAPAAGTCSCK